MCSVYPVAAHSSQECLPSPSAPLLFFISLPPSTSFSHLLNSVQTPVLNLDFLCLTKHMECYCSGMLQVWVFVCVSVFVCNPVHVLKQIRASTMMMIMIMVRVCLCAYQCHPRVLNRAFCCRSQTLLVCSCMSLLQSLQMCPISEQLAHS